MFPGFDFDVGGNKICTEAGYICMRDIQNKLRQR